MSSTKAKYCRDHPRQWKLRKQKEAELSCATLGTKPTTKKMSHPKFTYSGRICCFAQFLILGFALATYNKDNTERVTTTANKSRVFYPKASQSYSDIYCFSSYLTKQTCHYLQSTFLSQFATCQVDYSGTSVKIPIAKIQITLKLSIYSTSWG